METSKILIQFQQAYGSCESYQDVGYCEEQVRGKKPRVLTRFSTKFKRPAKLRFEWISGSERSSDKCLIASDGVSVWMKYSFEDSPRVCEDLGDAIGRSTGISEGVVRVIPALLTDAVASTVHAELMDNAQFLGMDSVEGVNCFMIQVSVHDAGDSCLWISESDFTLRRFSQGSLLGVGLRARSVGFASVALNSSISDGAFSLSSI